MRTSPTSLLRFVATYALPFLLAAGMPAVASAGSSGAALKQVATAIEHAHFASQGKTTSIAHLHLHHVINCLVGPKGKGFDGAVGDPCKGQGNGALNDFNGPERERVTLKEALSLARIGTRLRYYEPAHHVALAVHALLVDAHKAMEGK
ncbi:MAG: hypothetical protein P8180_03365 [Gammaproteobacteria bacterium]|jgi:hypothetical protein